MDFLARILLSHPSKVIDERLFSIRDFWIVLIITATIEVAERIHKKFDLSEQCKEA